MKVKTAVLWWLVTGQEHPALTPEDKTISAVMPLISRLFPGINFFSVSGFNQVVALLVVPALIKQHPTLAGLSAASIKPYATLKVRQAIPCSGYDWQESDAWWERFRRYLG